MEELHEVIQALFLWEDRHLWEFRVGDRRFGMPDEDDFEDMRLVDARHCHLVELLDLAVTSLDYTYDLGDDWRHRVEVVEQFKAPIGAKLAVFMHGEWRSPPEDVGGLPGFETFLQAMNDPKHQEHDDYASWYGRRYDPTDIERAAIQRRLARLADRLRQGRRSLTN